MGMLGDRRDTRQPCPRPLWARRWKPLSHVASVLCSLHPRGIAATAPLLSLQFCFIPGEDQLALIS